MDHFLEARHTDAPIVAQTPGCLGSCHTGTHWHDTQYTWYGDGVNLVSSPAPEADRMHVLLATDEAIELSYEWDEVRLDSLRAPQSCVLGVYPECGPTSRDHEGVAVYKHNEQNIVKSIKAVKVWKTVRVERCTPGYYVSIRTQPPLIWGEQGPRALRLGYVTSAVAFDCTGTPIARHPEAGEHVDLGWTTCIADIPANQSEVDHEGWPFLRFMLTSHERHFTSLQYSTNQHGSPGVADLWDVNGVDGRPEMWQAFIGAIEYVSPDVQMEPTQTALDLINSAAEMVTFE